MYRGYNRRPALPSVDIEARGYQSAMLELNQFHFEQA